MARYPFSSWVPLPPTRGVAVGVLGLAFVLGLSARVQAQPQPLEPGPASPSARPTEDEDWEPKAKMSEIALDSSSGFSLGLGAYGGLALLMTREANRPHALAGVLSRARYGYGELGAVIEFSDRAPDEWRSLGGFAGAWLPYRNWVDFELAAGLSFRRYLSSDPRYGAAGYELRSPALTLRLGVSDRSSEALFGARIGGEIVAAIDLRRRAAAWQYQTGNDADSAVVRGSTPVSGFSIGFVLSTGFDVVFKPRRDSVGLSVARSAPRW